MCKGSKTKLGSSEIVMGAGFEEKKDGVLRKSSSLLELAAADDLAGFIHEIEEKGFDIDDGSFWYGRRFGSKKMGFEERTPLMIASMYGSTEIVNYIIGTGKIDVNRASSSDLATALHCAAAGGSDSSVQIVKLLIDASADINSVDGNGNKPGDLIPFGLKFSSNSKRKELEILLKGVAQIGEISTKTPQLIEKKEYPVDVSLPDINIGLYGTDEFRMYSFKVKPCSRAYSHDWTECPFVHPGENARRRDPKKYTYSCVPCPEFRKGSCVKGDGCEYAHGVFESWLHPAQYRTRLCKDETGCARKVCFFAHKVEELRPLYASTGSAMPSPKSVSVSSMDMGSLSPMGIGSSTPPMSPVVACSSPMGGGNLWQNKVNITPPALQLPGSRLKTALNARDMDLEMELLGLESIHTQQQRQQLIDDLSSLSSPSMWNNNRFGEMKPTNLDDVFGSLDSSYLSQLQGLSPRVATTANTPQMQSPTGHQMRSQNMNQLRASYPSNISSSPARKASASAYGFDSSAAVAAAVMNSRSSAFAKRSQSFIDRGAVSNRPAGFTSAMANSTTLMSSNLSDWSSPNGKLEWGYNGDDKLKKSASFGFRSSNYATRNSGMAQSFDEPDVSWVNSLVKDVSSAGAGLYSSEQKNGGGVHEMLPLWAEQMYIEQEQMVA